MNISDAPGIEVEQLQSICLDRATGGGDDSEYQILKQKLTKDPRIAGLLPRFVHANRTTEQFWQFIKPMFPTYAERRSYIWEQFAPLLARLEQSAAPSDKAVGEALPVLTSDYVQQLWHKALERRATDFDGAITLSRTLLESVCKHILDDLSVTYDDGWSLPKLYATTATSLRLAPSQHSEQTIKQILSGCTSVVTGIGSLRNKTSDAHGQGTRSYRPAARHAELAVNMAGSMAMFLVSTWVETKKVKAGE